jgi:hypothetical protein
MCGDVAAYHGFCLLAFGVCYFSVSLVIISTFDWVDLNLSPI